MVKVEGAMESVKGEMERVRVSCSRHGKGWSTYLCQHLLSGLGCGFHTSRTCTDEWPDAWCDQCAAAWAAHGTWNDELERQLSIGLACSTCYGEARELNRVVPAPFVAGQLAVSGEERERMIEAACRRAQTLNDRADKRFQFGRHAQWTVDDEAGLFKLTTRAGAAQVVARMQIVGSFSRITCSWLWSWGNASLAPRQTGEVARLRALGEVRGMRELSQRLQEGVDEQHGWHLTALAAQVLGYDVCYRAPTDRGFLFLILKQLRWVS